MPPRAVKKVSGTASGKANPVVTSRRATRAASPSATLALAAARIAGAMGHDEDGIVSFNTVGLRSARRAPIQGASSLLELLSCVPGAYREVMRPFLAEAMKARRQLADVETQLSRLIADQTAGRIPPHLKMKSPSVQYTKHFISANPDVANVLSNATAKFQSDALSALIINKRAEVSFLRAQVTLVPDDNGTESATWRSILTGVSGAFDRARHQSKIPTWGDPTADSNGNRVFTGWQQDTGLLAEHNCFLEDLPLFFSRALSLVEDALLAEEQKEVKKKALKEDTMMDVDSHINSSSIQSMIDKRVAALLKTKGKGKGPQVSTEVLLRGAHSHLGPSSLTFPAKPRQKRQTDRRQGSESGGDWVQTWSVQCERSQASWRQVGQTPTEEEEWGWTPTTSGVDIEGERQGEGVVETPSATVKVRPFRWDRPTTYPDWLLSVPFNTAARYIVQRTPIVVLESLRYRSTIHMIDCELPRDLALHLSAGMKYMLPTRHNIKLIADTWDDFVDRLRWRVYFESQADDSESTDDFDPDYAVPRNRKVAGCLDRAFEFGVHQGGRAVREMVSQMPDAKDLEDPQFRASISLPVAKLRDYLTSHELVVLITDKNLGCAVAPRSWIVAKTRELLGKVVDYIPITNAEAYQIVREKNTHMRLIAKMTYDWAIQTQLPEFFRSQISDKPETAVPNFYVIPKIHKNPMSARPILPCHSVPQGPAGKYVSKTLKPIVKSAPYVLHGTKDLAIKLSRLQLPQAKFDAHGLKRLFLVSGDVVAFYPNVDVHKAHAYATVAYQHWLSQQDYGDNDVHFDAERCARLITVFRECLQAADSNLICQFQGRFWKQARGLAMGVNSSPDLANLYGAYYEERCPALQNPDVVFYGRYIDDCLGLVYAYSEADALGLLRDNLVFDNCTITWSSSNSHMTFLDMMLFFHDGRLEHKPYRKPMNHFERIPFISHHPNYVKRGTFLSELSRLATLSSRFDDFASACREAADIYIARGYPPVLIAAWLRENYQVRWDARLREVSPLEADVLVLKSEYNTSWDYFNVQRLEEQIKTGWAVALRSMAFGNAALLDEMAPAIREAKFNSSLVLNFTPESSGGENLDVLSVADASKVSVGMNGRFLRLDKLGLLERRFLVSKKKTKQLYDLTSMWRKSVLERRDRQVFGEVLELHRGQRTLDSWLNIQNSQ